MIIMFRRSEVLFHIYVDKNANFSVQQITTTASQIFTISRNRFLQCTLNFIEVLYH